MTKPVVLPQRLAACVLIAFLLSCDDDPTGPVVTTVTANSETSITGVMGVEVPTADRPSVLVLDQNGDPVEGVTVTFAVTSGNGFITGATPETDAAGIATVGGWTLGDAGANTLAASVENATPIVFSAHAIDPCVYVFMHQMLSSYPGQLTTIDCPLASPFTSGTHVDIYNRPVSRGLGESSFHFTASSTEFDTFLLLTAPNGALLAVNDNATGTSTNSTIRALLPDAAYGVLVTSSVANAGGAYTLSSAQTPSAITNCDEVWVARGITTSQNLQTTDCLSSGFFSDDLRMYLRAGQVVTVTMTSSAFDAFLEVYRADGTRVAFNDDMSAGTQNAQLTYTATADGFYAIVPTSGVAGATGADVLSVQ